MFQLEIYPNKNKVFVSEFNHVLNGGSGVEDIVRRASKVSALPKKLKNKLLKRLSSLES